MGDPISPEVKRFIHTHLHGFSQLELLLHLRDTPHESLTAEVAARELRLGHEQAADLLADLHTRGLLAVGVLALLSLLRLASMMMVQARPWVPPLARRRHAIALRAPPIPTCA